MQTLRRFLIAAGLVAFSALPAFADWWYTDRDVPIRDNRHQHRAGCGHVFVDGVWRVQRPVVVHRRNATYVYVLTEHGWQAFGYVPDRERMTPTR